MSLLFPGLSTHGTFRNNIAGNGEGEEDKGGLSF